MAAVAFEALSEAERNHWSAERIKPGVGVSGQVDITWRALQAVRKSVGPAKEEPTAQKVSSILGTPVPVPPVPLAHAMNEVDPGEYFSFPAEFNVNEIQIIFRDEIRTHNSDGGPFSVYFGPTRINLLADAAIETYGEPHTEAIHAAAKTVIDAYMAKF